MPSEQWQAWRRRQRSSPSGNIALIRAGNAQIEGDLANSKICRAIHSTHSRGRTYNPCPSRHHTGIYQLAVGKVEASLQAVVPWMDDMQKLGNHMYAIASAFVVADMQVTLGRLGEAEKASDKPFNRLDTWPRSGSGYRSSPFGIGNACLRTV